MRRVFAQMGNIQEDMLQRLNVSPFDYRLRRIRAFALRLFEKTWVEALNRRIVNNEEESAALYARCLAKALTANRIEVPQNILPENKEIDKFLAAFQ